jgi:MATE family, multidrug efflux pump
VEGLSEAASALVSGILGEGRASRVRALLVRSISIGYAVSAPLAILALVFPEQVLWVFTDEPELVALSVAARGAPGSADRPCG